MRPISTLALSVSFVAAVYGCVGDDPTPAPGAPTEDGAAPAADASRAVDGAVDGAPPPSACVLACADANTLHSCSPARDQVCALGCSMTDTPHCAALQPRAPVDVADLTAAGTTDLVIGTTIFLDTDTGAIDGIRPGNASATTSELVAGIGFRLAAASNVGVFTVKSLVINDTVSLIARGHAALAIVASDTITVQGILDARGYDASGTICNAVSTTANTAVGPGGHAGATAGGAVADGAGGGHGGAIGGGGGGGFAGGGGDGGHTAGDMFVGASVGGAVVAAPALLSGGFGGGAGGGGGGGAGGGAVQLVAGVEIKIGGGSVAGGINVGGCGGVGGAGSIAKEGGGGGGSGGSILLQSPKVTMFAKGVLAANGGAGGSGGGRGPAGALSDQPAEPVALSGGANGAGGAGSAALSITGSMGAGCGSSCFGGGGGGGAGFVRVESGSATLPLPGGAIVSPSLGSPGASAAKVPTK